jgi:hypothetical protein
MRPDPKKIHQKKEGKRCRVTGCLKHGNFENGICDKCRVKIDKSFKIGNLSKKRIQQNKDYSKIRIEFLKLNPICAVTGNQATEIHHKKGRTGGLLTDVRYFLPVCREAHIYIENNPKWAKEMGYSLNRLSDE